MTEKKKREISRTSDTVAVILAIGISVALITVTTGLLYAAIIRLGIDPDSGLSENATQLLTGWGGGIIGVLGSYLGFVYGRKSAQNEEEEAPPPSVIDG